MERRHNFRINHPIAHAGPGRGFTSRARRSVSSVSLAAVMAAAITFAPAAGAAPADGATRMVVEAKELVYDQDKNVVTARGDVQIYYKGRILQADRVSYDRNTKRVYAEGHAVLTERDGAVTRADHFDLTDDLKTGFIESLETDTTDKTHFSAPRAERAGDADVFNLGTYSACDACKDDPSRPRLWQVRAKRIIHDNVEKMIYYEDASFEFLGVPIAYVPFLYSPDPSVKRKSGLLNPPQYVFGTRTGSGVQLPSIYWAIAPDYDLTITPTYFLHAGPLVSGVFRQRFENGGYEIVADGAYVTNPKLFPAPPSGAQDRRLRGSLHSAGEFAINDFWKFGWDINALSDRFFATDYQQYGGLMQNYFFREQSSTVYLTGQGPRSYFELKGFYFQVTSPNDVQAQQPVVHPVLDYNRTFDISPERSFGIGGQLQLDANFTSTSANVANFESIQPRTLDRFNGVYNVCQIYAPAADRAKSGCLLRGIGGNYEHATVSADWKRKFIDPVGGVWTPFAFARFSGSYLDYNTSQFPIYNNAYQPIPNAAQGLFLDGTNQVARGQATPGFGIEWRYPLLARSFLGDVVLEPIAQVVARPNQSSIPSLVNMDAQSLVFDGSTLFEWSKFSGYDRFETGTRLNYGGQATYNLPNGGSINALAGQSVQLAGANPYAQIDAANVGLSSGLNTRASDLVGRLAFAPTSYLQFIAKGRFDKDSLAARRIDLVASFKLAPITLDVQYANYASQPAIGFTQRRQGLSTSGRYDLTKNYFLTGNVTFDMTRYLYNNLTTNQVTTLTGINLTGRAPVFSIATLGLGGGYSDECTTLMVNYSSSYEPTAGGLPARNQKVLVTLQLRTLGEFKTGRALGSIVLKDGVGSSLQ